MKIKILPVLLASLALIPALAFSADLGSVRMSLVQGDVQIQSEDTEEWVPAAVNTPLGEGDRVWVPDDGLAEVQIVGGVVVRLDASTSFDILRLDRESSQLAVNTGRIYVNTRGYGVDHLQIDTPVSSIGCYERCVVMIDVAENGATDLSVLGGDAYAETGNGKVRVEAGNTLGIGEDLTAEMFPLDQPDSWERWNRERDARLARSRDSLRYLPDELDDYASDLDANGRWVYAADYGYVWAPFVSVSVGWSPYRVGRWVWCRGHYVWISYEPWGWAPYHYGRWAYLPTAGWCWVPPRRGAVYWAPGYVGWVHTPTYVSWVPLAPGDVYYGRGYFGPGSVNVTINKTVVHQEFRNIHVRNAVTVQHRDAFVHGRKVDFRASRNPFTLGNVSAGPPAFRPDIATRMPVIRKIPRTELPPSRVQRINPESIRKERRLVTNERSSVFRPQRPVRQMPVVEREKPLRWVGDRKPGLRPEARPQTIRPPASGRAQTERRPPEMERQTAPIPAPDIRSMPPAAPQARPENTRQPRSAPQIRPPERRWDSIRQPSMPPAAPVVPRQAVQPPAQAPSRAEQPQMERGTRRIERQTMPTPTPEVRTVPPAVPQTRPETRRQPWSASQIRPPERRWESIRQPSMPPAAPVVPRQAVQPPAQAPSRVERPQMERGTRRMERHVSPIPSPDIRPRPPAAPQTRSETPRQPQSAPQIRPPQRRQESIRQPGTPPAMPSVPRQAVQPPPRTPSQEQPQGGHDKGAGETKPSSGRHGGRSVTAPSEQGERSPAER